MRKVKCRLYGSSDRWAEIDSVVIEVDGPVAPDNPWDIPSGQWQSVYNLLRDGNYYVCIQNDDWCLSAMPAVD